MATSYPTAILKSHAIPVLRNITPGTVAIRGTDISGSVNAPSLAVAGDMLCSKSPVTWWL